jgi:predicted SAM-dependent methyltransferase
VVFWGYCSGEVPEASNHQVHVIGTVAMIANSSTRVSLSAIEPVRLDLACGQNPREGFEGVDIWEGARHQINLLKFPWPFESDSVTEIHCSHFIEHIPMAYLEPDGTYSTVQNSPHAKDLLFAFFDECYRILKKTDNPQNPLGKMTITCPAARSNRGFQDPTHRRFIVAETFMYLNRDERIVHKLDHYNVNCNFVVNVAPMVLQDLMARPHEWQQVALQHYWNTVLDWEVNLVAVT